MDIIVRDLSNLVAISSKISSEEMEQQINWLLIQNPHFVHIAVAPISSCPVGVPLDVGQAELGRDVREFLSDRQSVARTTGSQQALASTGRSRTPDGKDTFAIFFPVFVKENGQRRVWGRRPGR